MKREIHFRNQYGDLKGGGGLLLDCLSYDNNPEAFLEIARDVLAKVNPKRIYIINDVDDFVREIDRYEKNLFLWHAVALPIIMRFLGENTMVYEMGVDNFVVMMRARKWVEGKFVKKEDKP